MIRFFKLFQNSALNVDRKKPLNLSIRTVIGVKLAPPKIPETKSLGPNPRIQVSINFNSENNIIVIYRGRNELKMKFI